MELGDTVKLFGGTEDGFVMSIHPFGNESEIYFVYSYRRKGNVISLKSGKKIAKIILLEKHTINNRNKVLVK